MILGMKTTQTTAKPASHQFTKVAPYLYRTDAGKYYGRVKRNGKIHQQSLATTDYQTAKNKLKDFIREIESKAVEVPDITFEDAGKQWLDSLYDFEVIVPAPPRNQP